MNIVNPGTRNSIDRAVRIDNCLKIITETIIPARAGKIKKSGLDILNSFIILSAIITTARDKTNNSKIPLNP